MYLKARACDTSCWVGTETLARKKKEEQEKELEREYLLVVNFSLVALCVNTFNYEGQFTFPC